MPKDQLFQMIMWSSQEKDASDSRGVLPLSDKMLPLCSLALLPSGLVVCYGFSVFEHAFTEAICCTKHFLLIPAVGSFLAGSVQQHVVVLLIGHELVPLSSSLTPFF